MVDYTNCNDVQKHIYGFPKCFQFDIGSARLLHCRYSYTDQSISRMRIIFFQHVFSSEIVFPRHKLFFNHKINGDFSTAEAARAACIFDFVFAFSCDEHAGSNGLKWGMSCLCSDDILDRIHISIKSLISGSTALHAGIDHFLATCLGFEHQTLHFDERRALWQALGVDEGKLDEFAFLNPRWDGNTLVAEAESEMWVLPICISMLGC